ncbi:hypothetical protein Droror1_Dr00022878 [Drosera rotundifolia]
MVSESKGLIERNVTAGLGLISSLVRNPWPSLSAWFAPKEPRFVAAVAGEENDRKMSGAAPEEDKKPGGGGEAAHINLKVKGQSGNEVFFRIKRNTQLKKLMNAYCDRESQDINAIAFLFDGRRLRGDQTPNDLEMEDGDEIDAMLHQTGGSGIWMMP